MKIFEFPFKKKSAKSKDVPLFAPLPDHVQVFADDEDDALEIEARQESVAPPKAAPVKSRAAEKVVKQARTESVGDEAVKIKDVWFVSTLGGLNQVLDRVKKPKLVLRGELVLVSQKEDLSPGQRYVRQVPRVAAAGFGSLLKSESSNAIVSVWIMKDAVERLFADRVNSVTLEIDQLLKFASSKKGKKILITAWKQSRNMPTLALVMKDGVIEQIVEKSLKERDFERDLRDLVQNLREQYAAYEMTWVDPEGTMPEFLPAGIENAGASPFSKLITKPLLGEGQKITFSQRYGIALGITLLSIAAYAGVLMYTFQQYADVRNKSRAILSSFKADKEFTTAQLGILQARRFYIADPRPQAGQIEMLRKVITAVNKLAVRAWIADLSIASASAEPETAQVQTSSGHEPVVPKDDKKKTVLKMTLRVAKNLESDGVTQLESVPMALANELGIRLSTTAQIQDVTEAGRGVRQIKLIGEF
jgi:hypothetical protein